MYRGCMYARMCMYVNRPITKEELCRAIYIYKICIIIGTSRNIVESYYNFNRNLDLSIDQFVSLFFCRLILEKKFAIFRKNYFGAIRSKLLSKDL